ncbi:electron transfer flavoprotein beta subunit lysine methyltransferase-like [Athalia rosae]|uniref:electron transfer flavoprotein beta subunit lysine methyltransferase-like n=1 Tax=Athalia rosae TaxID=37344 RepID=UPI002033F7B7|nr:electron transfer flavoprotein beta subunit lysine methyltransferase-like [Athalia rosae]XP_048505018.1 electron transfer flavoprotein beta subunit lysine methyltransferase-like [Athalia rosae]
MRGRVTSVKKSLLSFAIGGKTGHFARVEKSWTAVRDSEESITRGAILRNTEITRNHLTPEISLHLLTPNCPLYHAPAPSPSNEDREHDPATIETFREPFWSIYWPGGQALARFVLDHGEHLFQKGDCTVLDLGTGCGATAIAAKLRGASEVVANDIDPVACVAAGMNAALNKVRLRTSKDNLLAESYRHRFDVIFVGDLLYDAEIAEILEPWLDGALLRGAKIYLGDPGRHGVTDELRKKLKRLKTYPLPENVRRENYGFDSSTVWQFSKIP